MDRQRSGTPRTQQTHKIKAVKEKIRRTPDAPEYGCYHDEGSDPCRPEGVLIFIRVEAVPVRPPKANASASIKVFLTELKGGTDTGDIIFRDYKLFHVDTSLNNKNEVVLGKSPEVIPASVKTVTRLQKPLRVMIWADLSGIWTVH